MLFEFTSDRGVQLIPLTAKFFQLGIFLLFTFNDSLGKVIV